ncbi:MAG: SDR family NAD(P)-dependent oxidoreductase, partial [Desulfobacterales bacterium]|nr:SDR family NAD(P)-dependent oxidoreductase [Desulfobacterales bacterium]
MNIKFHKVLITGAAGFIGFHLAERLLDSGYHVTGVDNLNPYYDVRLKEARLAILALHENFEFHKIDLSDKNGLEKIFSNTSFDVVVNLAAQAGVRYSLTNPNAYVDSNISGFVNILECCRHSHAHGVIKHLVFASSSSVYGANTKMPFSVHDNVDHPVSLYAASKKSNELMAHTYSHL